LIIAQLSAQCGPVHTLAGKLHPQYLAALALHTESNRIEGGSGGKMHAPCVSLRTIMIIYIT
jgi:hypothetical protein